MKEDWKRKTTTLGTNLETVVSEEESRELMETPELLKLTLWTIWKGKKNSFLRRLLSRPYRPPARCRRNRLCRRMRCRDCHHLKRQRTKLTGQYLKVMRIEMFWFRRKTSAWALIQTFLSHLQRHFCLVQKVLVENHRVQCFIVTSINAEYDYVS